MIALEIGETLSSVTSALATARFRRILRVVQRDAPRKMQLLARHVEGSLTM